MVLQESVDGLSSFFELVAKHKDKKIIYALFCGGLDSATGESWCPDCVSAEPVIEKGLAGAPEDAVLIKCSVGDRTSWKDPNNEFRVNEKLRLKGVPTLLQMNSPKRLVEEDCSKADLVEMFIQDD
ncbi:thioredoxin domain-containing protein 17-like [Lytechinus variegatus]|uniref:thioredoxin domain-containing protein 17-like n=1 Tax=Lytechinus variegatus TaxID=7654 RepID=UPI001BB26238|nr:thioredoxin domain-containing protein 17-like [Lytechinus variegatus]